jgi:hypothetical protein
MTSGGGGPAPPPQLAVACAFAVRTMRVTFDRITPRREQVVLTLGEFGPLLVFAGATRRRTEVLPGGEHARPGVWCAGLDDPLGSRGADHCASGRMVWQNPDAGRFLPEAPFVTSLLPFLPFCHACARPPPARGLTPKTTALSVMFAPAPTTAAQMLTLNGSRAAKT